MRYLYVSLCLLCSTSVHALECMQDIEKVKTQIKKVNQSYETKLVVKFGSYANARGLNLRSTHDMYSTVMDEISTDRLIRKLELVSRTMTATKEENCKELVAIQQEKLAEREAGWPQVAKLLESY